MQYATTNTLGVALNPFRNNEGTAGPVGLGAPKGSIMETVYPVQVQRLRQDVGKWREALARAEQVYYPERTQLLNIYADTVLDLHLTSVLATRKINVTSQSYRLVGKDGKENPKLTKLLRRPWFREFCRFVLEKVDYGHSLIEFAPPVDGEFYTCDLIPRQYVFPEAGIVRTMPGMINGVAYRTDPSYSPWLIEVGKPRDLGLLLKLAPAIIWKNLVIGAWADFVEMFGMPYRALTGDFDEGLIGQFNTMMANMGQAAYGIFPGANTKMEFVTAPNSTGDVYDKYLERINSEVSKAVLGQTMTTDNGSSRSQSEVHERVAASYMREDADDLAEVINEQLLPFLVRHGYPVDLLSVTFEWDQTETLGKKAQFEIVQGIMQTSGRKVSAKYLAETFGVEFEPDEAAAAKAAEGAGGAGGKGGSDAPAPAEARPILGYHIEEGVVSRNEARAQLLLPEEDDTEAQAQQKLKAQLSVLQAATTAGVPLAQALKLAGLDTLIQLPLPTEGGEEGEGPGKTPGLPAFPTRQAPAQQ